MKHFSGAEITLLALWSYGVVLAKSSGQSKVVATLAGALTEKESNLRQRLREWLWDQKDKRGKKRTDWDVSMSFGPLLKWVLTLWPAGSQRLALAMDATTMKNVFIVLAISVVWRGCAVPVAWAILPGGKKNAWKEHWLRLLNSLKGIIPPEWQVIVMADRGLYAAWLYKAIQDCNWHPFLRINRDGKYRRKDTPQYQPLKQLLPNPEGIWSGQIICFMKNSLTCTLLATWGRQYKEPWLILTDLPPEQASATWYGMRSWIEAGFKDMKRDGWQWQKTRTTDPARAERFWLVLAISTLWVLSAGSHAEAVLPISDADVLPIKHIAHKNKKQLSRPRLLSCFARGLIAILTMLLQKSSVLLYPLSPDPWPQETYP